MEIFEDVVCVIFALLVLILCVLGLLCLLWHLTASYYCKYKLYKRNNKIQWRCVETEESMIDRLSKGGNELEFKCYLEYRILPSEVNKFVRMFGTNCWEPGFESYIAFPNNEEQFKKFVSNYKTYGEIKDFHDKENGVLWTEPKI